MSSRIPRLLLWLAFVGSGALVVWGLLGGPVRGEVPITAAPTPVAQTSPQTQAPQSQAPATGAVTTGPQSTPTPTEEAAGALPDLTGTPVHLEIRQGTEVIAGAPTQLTQLNQRGELNPEPRSIGWYGPPQWDTIPGNLSDRPGIFAGHVTHAGARDVFFRLGEVRKGDDIIVTYSDGAVARFVVDLDAVTAPKDDVTAKADTDYAWVWSLSEPNQRISVFSCDPSQGRDLTGHSVNNWVVQATRVE